MDRTQPGILDLPQCMACSAIMIMTGGWRGLALSSIGREAICFPILLFNMAHGGGVQVLVEVLASKNSLPDGGRHGEVACGRK